MVTNLPADNFAASSEVSSEDEMRVDDDVEMMDQEDIPFEHAATVPVMQNPPQNRKNKVLSLPATPFAGPYRSTFTLKVAETTSEELNSFKHVNCCYLSTQGLPPTLLQLKQHAQSLTVLIKHMTVSTRSAVIDNKNLSTQGLTDFGENESFDWLNDLTRPYKNNDRHHQMPLTSLLNTISSTPIESDQYVDMCPMHHADVRSPRNGISLPYATHQTLIRHANEVLELLDHEYSAKGGLLSILPPQDQKEDRELAETTLLGQLILYTSRLVQRVHDLECQYANALEAIKGEADVPHQTLSLLGPHGRKPREMVYPQDRFVLVNAGDDIWQYLNSEFQRKQAADEEADFRAREQGIMGEVLWKEDAGKDFARGITALDITTRYYRLRNDPLDTIFIIPAYQEHPGTKVIREMESSPTVVSVVKPVWPERASMWEMKNRENLEELKKLRAEHENLKVQSEIDKQSINAVFEDRQHKAQELRDYKSKENQRLKEATEEITRLNNVLKDPVNQTQLKIAEEMRAATLARDAALKQEQKNKETKEALDKELKEIRDITYAKEELKRLKILNENEVERLKRMEKTIQSTYDERMRRLNQQEAEITRSVTLTHDGLKSIWEKQIIEQQTLIEFLKRTKSAPVQGNQQPSAEDKTKGAAIAKLMIKHMRASQGQKLGVSVKGDGNMATGGDANQHGDYSRMHNKSEKSYGTGEINTEIQSSRGDIDMEESGSPNEEVKGPAEKIYHSEEYTEDDQGLGEDKAMKIHTGSTGEQGGNTPSHGMSKRSEKQETDDKKTAEKGPKKKRYRNKNDKVTWDLSDITNVEEVTDSDDDAGEC